jgi:hypothetical protein
VLDDSKKSRRELLDEYARIVTLTERPEHALRVREIIVELRKRAALGAPRPKRGLRLVARRPPPVEKT